MKYLKGIALIGVGFAAGVVVTVIKVVQRSTE